MSPNPPSAFLDEAAIVVSRVFEAPRPLVWKAFTDPEHVARWYGGHGFTNPSVEMDVRPGGLWKHVMRAPNGYEFAITLVFLEVIEPEKLVWTNAEDTGPGGPPVALNTNTFEDLGGSTKWTLVAAFKSLADRDLSLKMGFGGMVEQGAERLAAYLAAL
jgi:uncharacterized protein YndB with AHSA1/START domain